MRYIKLVGIPAGVSLLITLCVYLYNTSKQPKNSGKSAKVDYMNYVKVFLISLVVTGIITGVVLETTLVDTVKKYMESSGSNNPVKVGGKVKVIASDGDTYIDTSPPNF